MVIFSFCWIGFSVPVGSDQNSFIYLGDLANFQQSQSEAHSNNYKEDRYSVLIQKSDAAFFNPWLKLRELNKPH